MFERLDTLPQTLALSSTLGEQVFSLGEKNQVRSGDVTLSFATSREGMTLSVCAEQTGLSYLRLRWRWREAILGQVLGDALERSYGDLGWSSMQPYRALPWYFLIKHQQEVAGYGVRVRPCAFAFWQVDPAGVTLLLDLRNGGSPVYLGGRALSVCTILSKTYEGLSSFEAAQDFCGRLCTAPLRPPHPVYGSNNWYYAYGNSSREDLLKDADNLGELCQGFENPPYLVIDDGWQLCHTKDYNGGPFVPGPLYGDLSCLCQEIRERGERPGLWLRPLLDRSPALASLRLPHTGALDPSRPQVKEKIREELEEICSWGFALIKHDFSTFDIFGRWGFDMNPYPAASGWSFWDRSKTSAEILVDFYQLIREATQRTDTLILGCNTVGHLCAGLVHLQRTGDDTSGLLFERTVRYGVNTLAFRLPQHQRFFEVDADCAGITGAIPWEYNRQWCQLLAYSGTPMFVSVKPGVLSPAQKQELRDLLYVSSRQDRHLLPLDWEYTSQPLHWGEKGKDPVHFNWYEPSGLRAASGDHLRWEDYSQDDLFLSK